MKLSNIVKEIIEQNSITKQTEITDILFKKLSIKNILSNIKDKLLSPFDILLILFFID